jgi:hypothetical protein
VTHGVGEILDDLHDGNGIGWLLVLVLGRKVAGPLLFSFDSPLFQWVWLDLGYGGGVSGFGAGSYILQIAQNG